MSVSGAGDLNNDAIDDLVIGSFKNGDGATRGGAAYVFFGAVSIGGTKDLGRVQSADVTILGKSKNDSLGISIGGN